MTCIRDNLDLIDVVIVGAGPAGLAAALYTARAGLKTVVFGDPYQSQLAKAGVVENYLTYADPIQGLALSEKMLAHVAHGGRSWPTTRFAKSRAPKICSTCTRRAAICSAPTWSFSPWAPSTRDWACRARRNFTRKA
ncbi:MAG: FAD-dependent oxidoreductase [Chloroflexota bacterium]